MSLKQGTLSYGDRTLLQNVDLDLFEKEILVLSGASGTGKSSCLRALALLQSLDRGKLLFQGKTVGSDIKPAEWRSQVSTFYSLDKRGGWD